MKSLSEYVAHACELITNFEITFFIYLNELLRNDSDGNRFES